MNHAFILFFVAITTSALLSERGWARELHFGGGHSGSHHHFGGGMSRNFGSSGLYTNYGSPAFRSPGVSHFSYRSCPPSSASRYSYRWNGLSFSPGFSRYREGYRQRFNPPGPPPVGAPGPTPSAPGTPIPTPSYFYCVEHSFHYTNQRAFFGHLNFAHKVPLKHAAAYCQPVENGLIFVGD